MLLTAVATAAAGDSITSDAHTDDTSDKNLNGLDQLVAGAKPDDSDYEYVDEEERDYQELISNKSGNEFKLLRDDWTHFFLTQIPFLLLCTYEAKGMYIGAPCEQKCTGTLHHVHCDAATGLCACEKKYPVVIGLTKGCAKREYLFHYDFTACSWLDDE